MRASQTGYGLHVLGTLRAAVDRGARLHNGRVDFLPEDLRGAQRRGKESNLIVFVVDASGSMAARDRLAAVTGAVHSLLGDAYQRRDHVAVVSVRGQQPEVLLPPTGSIDVARRRLEEVKTGGRTPLPEGLKLAADIIEREHRREPGRRAILVILSDGKATGPNGLSHLRQVTHDIARRGLAGSIVIDCENQSRIKLGLAIELANNLGAPCIKVNELSAEAVTGVVNAI
ncbi:MAG: VWA domain-containing protein [Corynebacterium sp.]|nr:VWA domain-containing protein [Corynebacterium sp.]